MKRITVGARAVVGFGCLLGVWSLPSVLLLDKNAASLRAEDGAAIANALALQSPATPPVTPPVTPSATTKKPATKKPASNEASRDEGARDAAPSDTASGDEASDDKASGDKASERGSQRRGKDGKASRPSATPKKTDASKPDADEPDAVAPKTDGVAKADAEQKFVRTVDGDKGKPVVLQTAIVTYRSASGEYMGAQVDLIGAIHIADRAYFQKLNELFKGYDALLYEMVAEPDAAKQVRSGAKDRSAVSALQSGMKEMLGLSFQLDEVDYEASNFVHADMNPEEFTHSLSERQEGLMQFVMRSMGSSLALQGSRKSNDLDMLSALFSGNRELALKRVLAEQIEQMDGQLAAISGDDGKSTLITERNAKALQVLKRELDAGKKKIGIFYGAGHFRHMGQELDTKFHMQPVKTQWLDAWDMK